jgi:hypothetical protein
MRYKEWQLMFLFCFVKDIYEPSRLIKLSNKKRGCSHAITYRELFYTMVPLPKRGQIDMIQLGWQHPTMCYKGPHGESKRKMFPNSTICMASMYYSFYVNCHFQV